jgi:DNA modification methylase
MDIKTVDIEKIIPYAKNPRKNDAAVGKVAASLKEFGFRQPIVVDAEMVVIAGHTRLAAARKLKLNQVPIHIATDLTANQIKAYRIADNRVSQEAKWDDDLLALELADLDLENYDLGLTGFDDDELAALMAEAVTEGLVDEDQVPPEPETPVSVLGDIWQLGRHRVMCGDSTSIDAVDQLLIAEKIDLILTDPPYGIGYGGSMKLGSEKFGWKQHSGGWDEERPSKDLFDLLHSVCENLIIWGGNYFADILPPSMGWLIWDKGQRGFSLADGEMAWTSFNNALRIKEYSRALANKEEKHHATQKPIEILEWCLEYADRHSKKTNHMIYDAFGGSGSTLIACEKTNRQARLMELDPKYVDVIVKRWQNFTGLIAIHEKTGKTFNEMNNGSDHVSA